MCLFTVNQHGEVVEEGHGKKRIYVCGSLSVVQVGGKS